MTVTDVTATQTTLQSGKPPTDGQKISSDYQMFLKMLTAQMKNQDPLNPIESSDYAVQLATFSGVEQQVKTNDLLSALTSQMGVASMGQFASWVGMEARSTAPAKFTGTPITLYPNPAKGADKTFLVATDAQGHEVTRQEVPVKTDPLNWTGATATGGQALAGTYSFHLESYTAGKIISNDPVESYAKVTEVRQGSGGAVLVMEGGGTVLPSEIKALRPASPPPTIP